MGRWFYAFSGQKFGPVGWLELRQLVQADRLSSRTMVLREGQTQWAPASSVPDLFPPPPVDEPASNPTTQKGRKPSKQWRLWLAGGCSVLLLVVVLAWSRTPEPPRSPPKNLPSTDGPPARLATVSWQLAEDFLHRLNDVRQAAGLGLVTLDSAASLRCQEQAFALILDPLSPQTKEDGPLVFFREPMQALHDALARTGQRLLLLDMHLEKIGLGIVSSEVDAWVTVVQLQRQAAEPIVIFPVDRQQDVPVHFGSSDLPGADNQNAGYPITVTLPRKKNITEVRQSLSEAGSLVPVDVVKDKYFPGVGLLPKSALKPNATYRVDLALRIDSQPWHKTWLAVDAQSQVDAVGGVRLEALFGSRPTPGKYLSLTTSTGTRLPASDKDCLTSVMFFFLGNVTVIG